MLKRRLCTHKNGDQGVHVSHPKKKWTRAHEIMLNEPMIPCWREGYARTKMVTKASVSPTLRKSWRAHDIMLNEPMIPRWREGYARTRMATKASVSPTLRKRWHEPMISCWTSPWCHAEEKAMHAQEWRLRRPCRHPMKKWTQAHGTMLNRRPRTHESYAIGNVSCNTLPQNVSCSTLPQNASCNTFPQNASCSTLPQNASCNALPQNASCNTLPQNVSN